MAFRWLNEQQSVIAASTVRGQTANNGVYRWRWGPTTGAEARRFDPDPLDAGPVNPRPKPDHGGGGLM